MFDNIFLLYLIVDTDVRQIVSSIQSAALNDGEIQTLIDLLLNRQSGADQSNIRQSMLILPTHSGSHDLFLN
jgi:hypothetical protein